jgi:hypothetical protein
VRSHDLIRLLDEPGPESGAPSCKYLFWIDPMGMNAGGAEAESFGALAHARRRSPESGRFRVPATVFRATASLSLGKLKARVRPDSAEVSAYMVRWRPQRRA